jgi:hypothetical protein
MLGPCLSHCKERIAAMIHGRYPYLFHHKAAKTMGHKDDGSLPFVIEDPVK